MTDSLAQYRLRKAAIEMRSFTVTELTSATGINRESVQVFLHRLERKGSRTVTKENLPACGPGRPIVRYTLTSEGIEILASENAPMARQLDQAAPRDLPSLSSRPAESQRSWGRRVERLAEPINWATKRPYPYSDRCCGRLKNPAH